MYWAKKNLLPFSTVLQANGCWEDEVWKTKSVLLYFSLKLGDLKLVTNHNVKEYTLELLALEQPEL